MKDPLGTPPLSSVRGGPTIFLGLEQSHHTVAAEEADPYRI